MKKSHQIYSLPRRPAQGIFGNEVVSTEIASGNSRDSANRRTRRGSRLGSGLFDELIVDNFAGAGGASMGIEAACGRAVDIAINHDRHSVMMHQLNHPHTRHLCEDVWHVDPTEATAGRPVGLAWFSPDCRHFSRAKGGKPVKKNIRGLAWVVIRWAKRKKPRIIILENVREFQDWGPLTDDDRPCQKRKGQTYRRWRSTLENLGYHVETRVLNAADFGAPTHRRRFFLIARCDGQPINWPEPTHGPGRRPYRTAAQCIDWSLPCPSIFLTKAEAKPLKIIRPLAEKTMRRIAMGLKRYVLENPRPYIVKFNRTGREYPEPKFCPHCGSDKGWEGKESKCRACGEVGPYLIEKQDGLLYPFIAGVGGRAGQSPATGGDAPIGTITAKNDRALVAPLLVEVQNGSNQSGYRSIQRPAHTITANPKGGGMALAAPLLAKFRGDSAGGSLEQPLPTITSGAGSIRPAGAAHAMGIVAPFLASNYGKAPHQETRGQEAAAPAQTQAAQANDKPAKQEPQPVEEFVTVQQVDTHEKFIALAQQIAGHEDILWSDALKGFEKAARRLAGKKLPEMSAARRKEWLDLINARQWNWLEGERISN